MAAVGLVITFVGLGEKGFRTLELRLVGPGLVGGGLVLALLRILLCTVAPCGDSNCEQDCDCNEEHEHLLDDKQDIHNGVEKNEEVKLNGNILKDQVIVSGCVCEGRRVKSTSTQY